MSDSLQPHGLLHPRLPCPSPPPRACSNSHSWSLLKLRLMPIDSVMPSNHLILCRPLLLLPSIFRTGAGLGLAITLSVNFHYSCFTVLCYFYSTAKRISHTYVYILSLLSFLPIQVASEHCAESPLLYSRFSLVTYLILGFPGGSERKKSACMQEIQVPSLCQKDSPREGNGNPLHYSCLRNPIDREDWPAAVHGVTKSQTGLLILYIVSIVYTC